MFASQNLDQGNWRSRMDDRLGQLISYCGRQAFLPLTDNIKTFYYTPRPELSVQTL